MSKSPAMSVAIGIGYTGFAAITDQQGLNK